MDKKVVIHWFRKDLRVRDNTSLNAAIAAGEVVPVYILSQWRGEHRWTGAKRQTFLCQCLRELAGTLERMGSRLILRAGSALEEIPRLAREVGAREVHTNRDCDPFGRKVEAELQKLLEAEGIGFITHKDAVMWEGREVLTSEGEPFRVFTPYSRAWRAAGVLAPGSVPSAIRSPVGLQGLASLPLPGPDFWGLADESARILPGGEGAAQRRLREFLDTGRIYRYAAERDYPSANATSRISQDLRFGLLSIREVFAACARCAVAAPKQAVESIRKFESELIWREFYFQILWNYPEVLEWEFNPKLRGMAWPGQGEHLERWKYGQTGFPIVDAGMRELLETGFVHNRVRMIVAMFLTKDLHIDWRLGEQWFLQHLVDGEIASNNGGWQWSAGTGADAAPYFRIHNPWTQTQKFDPRGEYIRRWVPELRDVPVEALFRPPAAGEVLARGYPAPIVDHAFERERCLELFRQK